MDITSDSGKTAQNEFYAHSNMMGSLMRLNNKFVCAAGIIAALFAGQALLRVLREMRAMGGEAEFFFYLALWTILYAIIVCGLKILEYGSRRLKVLSLLLLAGSTLLLMITLPPSNLMLQAVMGMAICMIFVALLKYRPPKGNSTLPRSSRLRDMLTRTKK